jgi:hypothetical protein
VTSKLVEPGYGYVRVRQFQDRTGEDVAKALKDMYKQGELKGLVLDVRSDPGGLLNQAVAVSAAFLPKDALVVYTDGRTAEARMRLTAAKEHYTRRGEDFLRDLPAGVKKVPPVVLVDGGTASASEIVAGCRTTSARSCSADRRRQGLGERSLSNNPARLTTARYTRRGGRSRPRARTTSTSTMAAVAFPIAKPISRMSKRARGNTAARDRRPEAHNGDGQDAANQHTVTPPTPPPRARSAPRMTFS